MPAVYTCIDCNHVFKGQGAREVCSTCAKARESAHIFEQSKGKQYTAGELAEALSTLPLEQRDWPVRVGNTWGGPDSELVIEACQNEDEAYVWIGDPNA